MMRLGFLLVLFVFKSAFGNDVGIESVFAITRCRASCLDQFSHLIRTEENCDKDFDCLMCWETCEMLNTKFKVWGPICSVPDICFPGCQTACQSLSSGSNLNETIVSSLSVKSVYDGETNRILLEWMPDDKADVNGIIVYSVLVKDKNQDWEQIAQTTSHVVHLRKKIISRDSSIRLLAANATHLLSYTETTYVNSVIHGYEAPFPGRDNGWGPYLVSLERSDTSHNLLATITWLEEYIESEPNQYEISWNVIDDAMEVTGHLMTSRNIAILTLWPDSIYLVQVKRTAISNENIKEISEPLLIDTKLTKSYTNILKATTPLECKVSDDEGKVRMIAYSWILSLSLLFLCVLLVICRFRCQRKTLKKIKTNDEDSEFGEEEKLKQEDDEANVKSLYNPKEIMKKLLIMIKNFLSFRKAQTSKKNFEISDVV